MYIYCDCFLEYTNFKDDLIEHKVYTVTKVNNTSLMKSSCQPLTILKNLFVFKIYRFLP